MKKNISLLLLLLGLISMANMVNVPKAFACSCFASTPEELYSQAELIFKGRVADLKTDGRSAYSVETVTITFVVEKSIKGNAGSNITLTTPGNSAECGYYFQMDKNYEVYANQKNSGGYEVNLCGGTKLLDSQMPSQHGVNNPNKNLFPGGNNTYYYVGGGLAVILLGSLLYRLIKTK